ncbi:hypothetical protein CSOJ01_10151 [Colletotrichum sojae]|uniref:Uncharacterized protein n=1 Tax=Colletotrichum sojae TaxID=2175907 RepID=A0A8H6J1P1_9PEZI|nr:hypothetical protein CSOJ01_10151 [Colletotrichum sojae]
MKSSIFTLAFALVSSALAQQRFRCRCADSSGNNVAGIEKICQSRGGVAETSQLCIKATSRFSDSDCATVQQGSKGDCIVDTISDVPGTTVTVKGRSVATPVPRAETPQDE